MQMETVDNYLEIKHRIKRKYGLDLVVIQSGPFFEAIEEALSNAVYHKSYELGSPIEVQIFPDEITILSHPAPVPPVNNEVLSNQKRIIAREYRNRRIGDFLKELKLTEGRGTGLPSIYSSLEANGSPEPSFKTDDVYSILVLSGSDTGSSFNVNVV